LNNYIKTRKAVGVGAEAAVAHSLKRDSKKDGAFAHGISDYLRERFVQGSLLGWFFINHPVSLKFKSCRFSGFESKGPKSRKRNDWIVGVIKRMSRRD